MAQTNNYYHSSLSWVELNWELIKNGNHCKFSNIVDWWVFTYCSQYFSDLPIYKQMSGNKVGTNVILSHSLDGYTNKWGLSCVKFSKDWLILAEANWLFTCLYVYWLIGFSNCIGLSWHDLIVLTHISLIPATFGWNKTFTPRWGGVALKIIC